jgi:hypothetical protein
MTRDLSDDRYTTSIWLTQFSDNQTITNGGFQLLAPGRFNSWSVGYGASVPSGFTEFRVVLGFGWMQNPATNSTNFPVFVQFNNHETPPLQQPANPLRQASIILLAATTPPPPPSRLTAN